MREDGRLPISQETMHKIAGKILANVLCAQIPVPVTQSICKSVVEKYSNDTGINKELGDILYRVCDELYSTDIVAPVRDAIDDWNEERAYDYVLNDLHLQNVVDEIAYYQEKIDISDYNL